MLGRRDRNYAALASWLVARQVSECQISFLGKIFRRELLPESQLRFPGEARQAMGDLSRMVMAGLECG